ncbi:extracellular solute-binding protein [Aureimonas leprariae]|uniref:Extracellular solute-binding protein n=1 Tax=Plantimonas leprariae TaxID=2615207 RepID=A0A7V7TWV5_9HYPH|nr:extracellular solute-binding protein [Aureimonas leprariae]KAB0680428.1 extracellular solute-binding protein [Aureimonas leprariae]
MLAGAAWGTILSGAGAQELVTKDLVGKPDAPKSLVLRLAGDGPNSPDPDWAAGYAKLFGDFIAKHPDWKFEMQTMSNDIGQEQARMLEQVKSGRGPDCAAVDSFQLALFKSSKVLKPMTAYFKPEEVSDLFPYVQQGIKGDDGEIYAWWYSTDLRVLYRNKSVVPEAPKDWSELKKAALASVDEGTEGFLFNGSRYEGTVFDWLSNFWSQGGQLVDDKGKPVFAAGENRAKILKAIGYYKDLVDSGAAPKRVTTIGNYNDLNAAAAAGTTALFVGGNWQLAQLKNTLDEDEYANWTFDQIPGPTADARSTGTGGWTLASFTDDREKTEMCATVAREIYAGPGTALQQNLPTAKALFTKFDVYKTPEFQKFGELLQYGQARPGVPIYPEISNQLQIAMGDVLSGTKTPEQALDAAAAAVDAAYKRL